MTTVPIYFSFDLALPEIVLAAVAWFTLFLALWPLMFLLRPRRRQKKITEEISKPAGGWPAISVVVYCRDEATSLEQLLEKLFIQEYDGEYEIIISSDGRNEDIDGVVKRLMTKFSKMRVTFVPDEARNLSRRKMAFTLGIKAAQHDIVLLDGIERSHGLKRRVGTHHVGGHPETTPYPRAHLLQLFKQHGVGSIPRSRGLRLLLLEVDGLRYHE